MSETESTEGKGRGADYATAAGKVPPVDSKNVDSFVESK